MKGARNEPPNETARPGGLWPTPEQLLLLRLCLGRETDVAAGYARWRELVDVDRVSSGTYRQLPMLGARLHAAGVEDDKSGIIKGTRRLTWVRNRFALRTLAALGERLDELDVPFIVLKGFALLIDGSYDDPGQRPAHDIDLLVRPEHVETVRRALLGDGWTAPPQEAAFDTEALMSSLHAASFERGENARLDLHWGAFHTYGRSQARYEFLWEHTVTHGYEGRTYRTLAPTEQLLHTAVHGARRMRDEPLRWLADATVLIERHGAAIDWTRLVEEARHLERVAPVAQTLRYLAEELDVAVPPAAIAALESAPRSWLERFERDLDEREKGRALQYVKRGVRVWRMAATEQRSWVARARHAGRYARACFLVPRERGVVATITRRYLDRRARDRA